MDADIENIFSRQAEVLPDEVRRFVASGSWEEPLSGIITRYDLSEDDADSLRTEISLVLAGLVHPGEFKEALKGELAGVDPVVVDTIAAEIGVAVLAPVRAALEEFFAMQEEGGDEAGEAQPLVDRAEDVSPEAEIPAVPTSATPGMPRMPDIAPDNLPTEAETALQEEAPLMPKLAPKMRPSDDASTGESSHPFEEKMKRVFASGGADISNLELPPVGTASAVPRSPASDPYREPIV